MTTVKTATTALDTEGTFAATHPAAAAFAVTKGYAVPFISDEAKFAAAEAARKASNAAQAATVKPPKP